jgi:glycosyltransferase involved in cell wall biosynthesis
MGNLPSVSIVVTYHNEGPLISRALESIAGQKYSGSVEVIVVDDCSTVPVPQACIPANLQVRILRTPKNLYAGGARNFGVRNSNGEYLMFLDADDEYCPGRIQSHIDFFSNNPTVVFAGAAYYVLDSKNPDGQPQLQIPEALALYAPASADKTCILPDEFRYWICHKYCFNTGALTFPREKFLSLGGFREDLRWGEEWELQARASRIGRVGFISVPAYLYVLRSNTVTSTTNPIKYWSLATIFRSYRKLVPDLPAELVKKARSEEHRAWLLACQLYLEHSANPGKALHSAFMAARCGFSLWAVRSLLRSILWFASKPVLAFSKLRSS